MTGFSIVRLYDLMDVIGIEQTQLLLKDFCCPYNQDIESFLVDKAIEFEKQGLSRTHLVYASYQKKNVLVGYFTLANKHFHIDVKKSGHTRINRNLRDRIKKFGAYDEDLKKFVISAPLIAQLSKNFSNGYDKLISGNELLELAICKVRVVQGIMGGKIVYLECEDSSRLLEFYSRNGFFQFNTRLLDCEEQDMMKGKRLIQMLKYM